MTRQAGDWGGNGQTSGFPLVLQWRSVPSLETMEAEGQPAADYLVLCFLWFFQEKGGRFSHTSLHPFTFSFPTQSIPPSSRKLSKTIHIEAVHLPFPPDKVLIWLSTAPWVDFPGCNDTSLSKSGHLTLHSNSTNTKIDLFSQGKLLSGKGGYRLSFRACNSQLAHNGEDLSYLVPKQKVDLKMDLNEGGWPLVKT